MSDKEWDQLETLLDKIVNETGSREKRPWKEKAAELRDRTGSSFEEIVGWFGGDVEQTKLDD